jgi:hypothetical protein
MFLALCASFSILYALGSVGFSVYSLCALVREECKALVLVRLGFSLCECVEEQWYVQCGEVLDICTKLYVD